MPTNGNSDLFKFKSEYYQVLHPDSDDNVLILCADDSLSDDSLSIGEGTDIGGDYAAKTEVSIFAESISISGAFKNGDMLISAFEISAQEDAVLDASGENGEDLVPATIIDDGPPAPGNGGDAGGTIRLYVDQLPLNGELGLILSVKGGDGSAGQNILKGDTGARGGDGGDGGAIVILSTDRFRECSVEVLLPARDCDDVFLKLDALQYCWNEFGDLNSLASCLRQNLQDILRQLFDEQNPTDDVDALLKQVKSKCGSMDSSKTDEAAKRLNDTITSVGNKFTQQGWSNEKALYLSNLVIEGGAYGHGGRGRMKYGENGSDGRGGTKSTFALESSQVIFAPEKSEYLTPDSAEDLPKTRFPIFHPVQCAMLLEKAKLLYMTAHSRDEKRFAIVLELFERLIKRTEAVVSNADAVKETFEKSCGTDRDYLKRLALEGNYIDAVAGINASAKKYALQIKQGTDFYGHDADHAPILSFQVHYVNYDENMKNFKSIEEEYDSFFDAIDSGEIPDVKHIKAIRDKIESINKGLKPYLDQMKVKADYAINLIATLQISADQQIKLVEYDFDRLTEEIKEAFTFDPMEFLKVVSSCISKPKDVVNMVSQTVPFLYKGITEIDTGPGGRVKKEYIINGISSFRGEVDRDSLTEAYSQLPGGGIDLGDPGAAKLLVEQQGLNDLLKKLSYEFPDEAQAVKNSFQKYVDLILQRNNIILEYNSILVQWNKCNDEIENNNKKIDDYNDDILAGMNPELPEIKNFVSNVYHNAREQVIRALYETSKAYRFWELAKDSDERHSDILTSIFGGSQTPVTINSVVLDDAKRRLIDEIRIALEDTASNRRNYFSGYDKPIGTGILYELESRHVEALKENEYCFFTVPTSTPDTASEHSVFSGMANIRLTVVRPWIVGVNKKGGIEKYLKCEMIHLGSEEFVASNGFVNYFNHEVVHFQFHFDPVNFYTLSRAGEIIFNTETTKDLFIQEDGIVGQQNLDISNPDEKYAAIGSFATWKLILKKSDNQNFDFSEISKIVIEFCGSNSSFNP